MVNDHLDDSAVQQYVLDQSGCDNSIIVHIAACESCRAKAAAYQLLFVAIKEQETPTFDFDLPGLVLSQLAKPKPQPVFNSVIIILLIIAAATLVVTGWLLRDYFLTLFAGISAMVVYLALTIAVTFLLFQGIEMYKKYQKKMAALNFN